MNFPKHTIKDILMDILFMFIFGLLAAMCIVIISSIAAGEEVFRDRSGRKIGSSTTMRNGYTYYRDASGRLVGTSSPSAGKYVYRDSRGRVIGSKTLLLPPKKR